MNQLHMLRAPAPAPEIPLPAGWGIRSMLPGEGGQWSRICDTGGFWPAGEMTPEERWAKQMGGDAGVLPENVFFVTNDAGKPVATATARFIPEADLAKYPAVSPLGYLHYVAALPETRGVGAGSAVVAEVLRRFAQLGMPWCVLTTDDWRVPAIKSYIRLGWLPILYEDGMRERWEAVLAAAGSQKEVPAVGMDGRLLPAISVK